MTKLEALIWRSQDLLRWVRAGAMALWLILLGAELTSEELCVDRFLRLLLVGGATIFLLHHCARAAIEARPRLRRKAALRAMAHDPVLASQRWRKEVIPFLLGRDSERVSLYPWGRRLESLVGMLTHAILSAPDPRRSWQGAMTHCLALLRLGRRHWRQWQVRERESNQHMARFHGLRDEELLQFLLSTLTLLSALFRLHLLLWGMPEAPWDRENLSRLRGRWIRFCTLEPTARGFPPPLPKKMTRPDRGSDTEIARHLIEWTFRGQDRALYQALDLMCRPGVNAEVPEPPDRDRATS